MSDEDTIVGVQIPSQPTVVALRDAAARCTGLRLYQNATQTVFGEGPESGPGHAGRRAAGRCRRPRRPSLCRTRRKAVLTAASPRRGSTASRPTSRMSSSTSNGCRAGRGASTANRGAVEIEACFPWLEAEIGVVKPQIVVALGATAAQALFGKAFRVTRDRGRLVPFALAPCALATVHPSALLRAPDEETRRLEIARLHRGSAPGRERLLRRGTCGESRCSIGPRRRSPAPLLS